MTNKKTRMQIGKKPNSPLVFAREFFREFETTGTPFQTSHRAAFALTEPLRERSRPLEILELGAGLGAVTKQILKDMKPQDRLTVCEINPRLLAVLRLELAGRSDFIRNSGRIRFMDCAAQHLPEDRKYDLVVCALPFLNFDLDTIRSIFSKLTSLSRPDTIMTSYEYIGFRSLNKIVSRVTGLGSIHEVDDFLSEIFKTGQGQTKDVWKHLLPIHIHRVTLGKIGNMAAQEAKAA